MLTCGYILHRLKPLVEAKLGFLLARSQFYYIHLYFAETFRNEYAAVCSTALRIATDKKNWVAT